MNDYSYSEHSIYNCLFLRYIFKIVKRIHRDDLLTLARAWRSLSDSKKEIKVLSTLAGSLISDILYFRR
jgi:hypothetical protein